MMREIDVERIKEVVKELCIFSNYNLPVDVEKALEKAVQAEESELAKDVLRDILKNAQLQGMSKFQYVRTLDLQ